MFKLYISGLGIYVTFICGYIEFLSTAGLIPWFCIPLSITKAGLIIQAYFKYLLMIMIIFFGPCSYTASGHLSVENVVQVFCNTVNILFCRRNTGVLRHRLCFFNTVIKRHIALPPNLESPSPRNNHPFFPFGWRVYIS